MLREKWVLLFFCCLLVAGNAFSKRDKEQFTWDPITESDWAVGNDSTLGIKDAAMIFEKITMDDRDLFKEKCYYSAYYRLRILSAAGRKQGDITIPLFFIDQEILSVKARTIRKNGDTTYLNQDQIIEKEVFKNRKMKVKQKSFSMPGLSDDCIIEYYIKLKLPNHVSFWNIQKDIALLHGELNWYLYYGKGLTSNQFAYMGSRYAPNFLSLCMDPTNDVEVERLPNLKETNQLVFTVDSIAAFDEEPYSLPEKALKGQLHYYYAEVGSASSYWGDYSSAFPRWMESFLDNSSKIKKIVENFENLPSDEEKIEAAYDWVNENLVNLTYIEPEKKIKDSKYETADKAIKSGYAKRNGITYIFCDMLREMNIDAKVSWVVDRDESIFVPEAKYWQFDRILVAVENADKSWSFYAPGEKYIPIGQVPWYVEGISALIGGAQSDMYIGVPFSISSDNSYRRSIKLVISDEFDVTSQVSENISGHEARSIRTSLIDTKETEYISKIKEYLLENHSLEDIDSITYNNIDTYKKPLELTYSVSYPNIENNLIGERILLNPLDYMEKISNPFMADNRREAIMFDYAYELRENVLLELPEGMTVEALPEDILIQNSVGDFGVSFSKVGASLSVQRLFKINTPYLMAADYQIIKSLYQKAVESNDLTVSLLYTE